MAVPESYEDYLRRTGTREAMEERQSLRQQGLLNAPVKGPHGLSACCKYLRDYGHRCGQAVAGQGSDTKANAC